MKSIKYFGGGTLKVVDVPEKQIVNDDDVKIKVAYCGVCGSDLHLKRAEFDFIIPPEGMDMGHEATGIVTELGPKATEKGLQVGDRVAYYFNTHCGSCYYCRNGQEQFCSSLKSDTSAMSEYIVVPEQSVYKLSDKCSLKKGALIEPISVSLHGVDMCHIKPGMTVAISGGGAMGLIISMLAKRSGATSLTVIEPIESKRQKALDLGADYVIDPMSQDRLEEAMKITEGRGFDVVIEASGNVRACDGIEALVAKGGTLEFFAAMYRPDYNYSFNLFGAFMREVNIVSGVLQSPYMFPRSVALVDSLDMEALLVDGCVFEMEAFDEAFKAQMEGRTIKSLIKFSDAE